MNKVFLIGRLTRDPELSTVGSGISVCKLYLAVNRKYKNADGETETDFFNIVSWRGLADNAAKYLVKGQQCAVMGSIQNRSYEDKDGNKRYATDIVAEDVEFLAKPNTGENKGSQEEYGGRPQSRGQVSIDSLEEVGDDLPF